jgi:5-hydroxyisourate hydrolase
MSPITVHVLDTASGKPAAGVPIALSRLTHAERDAGLTQLASGITNSDGRVLDLLEPGSLQCGVYVLRFDTAHYFAQTQRDSFYPHVSIVFEIRAVSEHYHVPLLLSPFGYSTYRGS